MKDEFKDQMLNYIWFKWKLACVLKTYRKCNPTVWFSKFISNKLLGCVTFFRVTLDATWAQP